MNIESYIQPQIDEDDISAVTKALRTGVLSGFKGSAGPRFMGGEYVREFESVFAQYMKVKYALTFNSCTSALHAAAVACLKKGDEVITTPYTFTASVKCALMVGAKVVFADIEEDTFNIDPVDIERKITPKTRAIIVVHLFGHPADMNPILKIAKEHNLKVIEDSAQSIGAKYHGKFTGTMGDCGVFSFDSAKTISTGEGGMLITNDESIYNTASMVRNHGEMLNVNMIGYNYRMTEFQAALGISQFKKLEQFNSYRQMLAEYLNVGLSHCGLIPPVTKPNCTHVYFNYAIRCPDGNRDEIIKRLTEKDIYMGAGYVKPLYQLSLYGDKKNLCPVAERMYSKELMCTCCVRHPSTIKDMKRMVDVIGQGT